MISSLLSFEIQEFIALNIDANISKLALQKKSFSRNSLGRNPHTNFGKKQSKRKVTYLVCTPKYYVPQQNISRTNFVRKNGLL